MGNGHSIFGGNSSCMDVRQHVELLIGSCRFVYAEIVHAEDWLYHGRHDLSLAHFFLVKESVKVTSHNLLNEMNYIKMPSVSSICT